MQVVASDMPRLLSPLHSQALTDVLDSSYPTAPPAIPLLSPPSPVQVQREEPSEVGEPRDALVAQPHAPTQLERGQGGQAG